MATVAAERAVTRTVTRLFELTDQRRWDGLADLFAAEVLLDYTSLVGGEPARLSPEEIVGSWRTTLGGLDATQHLVSNVLVDPEEGAAGAAATATAQFQATHVLANPTGDDTWTLGGHYRFELTRTGDTWRVSAMAMTATWASGNRHVMTLATGRPRSAAEAARAYRGEIELAGGGRYDNDYVGIFETRDGRIVRFVERFDPAVLSAAFGERMVETFSLDESSSGQPER